MPAALDLLNGQIEYQSAVDHESNILKKLTYVPETRKVYAYLFEHTSDIQSLTAHHLGVNQAQCVVSHWDEWIRGSFNVCIPVVVEGQNGQPNRTVLMRCPMAYRLGEDVGSVDEKIGCEVATYAWMQDNCPEVKIPDLLGFGFSDGRNFTHTAHRPLYVRILRLLRRRLCTILGFPVPSRYVRHSSTHSLNTGHLLLQRIEASDGEMLSTSWKEHMGDPVRRANLFKGLARITLSLARVPLPRIGSFTFRDDGTIALLNRPLTSTLAIMESYGIPRAIEQNTTYTSVEPYMSDLLTYHDHRFLNQPNAVLDRVDGQRQMAQKVLLRAIGHHFLPRDLRNGPYALRLTDLHQSNIFVDERWNVTYLIDLEWVCSLPMDMLGAPYWLTGLGIDQIHDKALETYDSRRQEYMHIFREEEEALQRPQSSLRLSELMQSAWTDRRYWYYLSLTSLNGMYTIFPHIYAKFHLSDVSDNAADVLSQFWDPDSKEALAKKLMDKEKYNEELRARFSKPTKREPLKGEAVSRLADELAKGKTNTVGIVP
ncbi:hypothetical protein K505DRAFT_380680 [Melanomma pulvis-pyrius CBS 109.77]|uniref:Aminoglycoside phosphotransferase domain-containing protein n=1 Tax=Melanomma pulvis-pyrius CBS 109.77 TaxID=1314802 RepID=A0A6A6WPG0_9PLEO|nr:hypothetical protein K505DRAFT_380680 [Melanomma pulvis-pyrius CBS 109.77]